ncbi:MAG TPA: DUF5662 family protein [Patescibacteria group bacterium]|nr:DUF5662 family protein [Patescibacteria group bacterium]
MTKADCIKETKQHVVKVATCIDKVIEELMIRRAFHDSSKMQEPELAIFTEFTPKLKNSTYGSDEYKGFLKEMGVALQHHYENNPHHPEHFENGIKGMTLVDIVEMFCDWKAATLRHDNGDIYKSIEFNKNRFGYSDDLEQIFINTAQLFDDVR